MKYVRVTPILAGTLWLASALGATAQQAVPPPPQEHAPAVNTTEEMSLAVGENRTISAADVKSFSEGLPGVADVKVTPGGQQFVIAAQKPGSTTLLLIKRDGSETIWKINVFPQPVRVVEAELTELLGDTPGLRVRRVGSRFFIEGGVTDEPDLARIDHIAQLYPGQVESLVVLGGVAADRKINIRVDLYFVQYSKTWTMQAGVTWPNSIGGAAIRSTFLYDFLSTTTLSARATLTNQPMPALDIASSKGWAKVLKHATLLTANGAEAKFTNGGSQWFPAVNGLTSTLFEIQFGTTLKVLPRYDPKSKEMHVKVDTDIIDLTPPITGATELPGTQSNKLNTAVALKLGQSIVLSGIKMSSARRTKRGIPYLSQIPIIGWLFGSTGRQDEDLEGAVFIVPSVVEKVPQRASELVDRTLREYDKYRGRLHEVTPYEESELEKAQGGAR